MYMYLAVPDHAISSVIIRQCEGVQRPVYYLSKTLVDAETRYLPLEKMALALVHAMRKLSHYFQAHIVWVLITKWGVRLGVFDICYRSRNSVKGQVLADFVVEFTPPPSRVVGVCQI